MTRAMEMIAAAKFRRSDALRRAAAPYFTGVSQLLARVLATAELSDSENANALRDLLLQPGAGKGTLLVLATADRGLCGAFNANLIRRAEQFLKEKTVGEPSLFCIGKKGYDYFRRRGLPIIEKITDLRGTINLQQIETITEKVLALFRAAAVGEVYIVYSHLISRALQQAELERALPVDPSDLARFLERESGGSPASAAPGFTYIFEPDRAEVLQALVHRYIHSKLYAALADHITSEHAARIVAMTNATRNCDDLTEALTLQLNKARQDSITKELLDIIGGAEALKT
jgi:F-type H+-transporting ATPase subunit gamma